MVAICMNGEDKVPQGSRAFRYVMNMRQQAENPVEVTGPKTISSIIHGAVVIPDTDDPDEYFVFEQLDHGMFVHMN